MSAVIGQVRPTVSVPSTTATVIGSRTVNQLLLTVKRKTDLYIIDAWNIGSDQYVPDRTWNSGIDAFAKFNDRSSSESPAATAACLVLHRLQAGVCTVINL